MEYEKFRSIETKNKSNNPKNNFNNIISYIILNEKGKILFSRQFCPITKSELLYHSSFFFHHFTHLPPNIKNDYSYIDNKETRYIYLSIEKNDKTDEEIISILVLNKNYNIFLANETIKLLKRVIFEVLKIEGEINSEEQNKIKGNVRV